MGKYINSDPTILSGMPVIKGTRVPIEVILHRLKEGNSLTVIHDMYPYISLETLSSAIEEAIQTINTNLYAEAAS
jgi:uncharacterized protein (DUF433 family)